LIEDDEFIAERIPNARASASRNVERALHGLAARVQEERESCVNIFNQNIGFWADVQVNHELRVGVRKANPDRLLASPYDAMPETIAIE